MTDPVVPPAPTAPALALSVAVADAGGAVVASGAAPLTPGSLVLTVGQNVVVVMAAAQWQEWVANNVSSSRTDPLPP